MPGVFNLSVDGASRSAPGRSKVPDYPRFAGIKMKSLAAPVRRRDCAAGRSRHQSEAPNHRPTLPFQKNTGHCGIGR
jgi:hypothetical protein